MRWLMPILRMTAADKRTGDGVDGQIHFLRGICQIQAIKNKRSKSLEFINPLMEDVNSWNCGSHIQLEDDVGPVIIIRQGELFDAVLRPFFGEFTMTMDENSDRVPESWPNRDFR
jgi:hypothetical protein